MARKSLRKLLLSLSTAVVLCCSWSGSVFADGDADEALEARIAELESLVQQLLQNQAAPAPAVEAKAVEAAEAKVTAMMEEHHQAVEEKAKKHTYKFGGFIKTDVIYSDFDDGSYAGAGRDFYIPATVKIGGEGESYLDVHAKESRINFKSTHLLDNGAKLGTYFEMDTQLSPGGDERISNSYNPRVRHAFATYNKWLFGQTWMTFYNVSTIPENLDFVGPADGSLFGRQTQIRYTSGPWMIAIENPETTITPYGGGGRIVADDNEFPDLALRYNYKDDWGTFSAAATLRQLAYQNNAAGIDDKVTGYGISLTGKVMINKRDDVRWQVNKGKGLGRYIGLNTTNGAVLDEHGNLHAIDVTGFYASFRHFWSEQWRSNLTFGYLTVDNDTALTGMGVTKEASSVHVNLLYSPQPKLTFGAELLLADRKIETGAHGNMTRLQFSAKYAY